MQENAVRAPISVELPIYKYFLKGERIAKDRVYHQMTTLQDGHNSKEPRAKALERHATILKDVLFA